MDEQVEDELGNDVPEGVVDEVDECVILLWHMWLDEQVQHEWDIVEDVVADVQAISILEVDDEQDEPEVLVEEYE